MEFTAITDKRRSVKNYDPSATISDAQLRALFELVVKGPSAFNLQHWSFVVSRDLAIKQQLQEAASGQRQVGSCAAVVLVCGKLDAYRDVAAAYQGAPDALVQRVDGMVRGFYADNPQTQRDEAIRGASLAAMSLLYAATELGLESGPMIGFDPVAVRRILVIPDNFIPVMMIVLGKGSGGELPKGPRHPLRQVVKLDRFTGPGLD